MENRVQFHVNLSDQPQAGLEDQLEFLKLWATQNGFVYSESRNFLSNAFNFIFDGAKVSDQLLHLLKSNKIPLFLIATEHLSFEKVLRYNGLPWSKQFDSTIDRFSSQHRLGELIRVSEYCEAIVILGDLPDIEQYQRAFPNKLIFNLDYPVISPASIREKKIGEFDLIFSAPTIDSLTPYRKKIIRELHLKGTSVVQIFGKSLEEFRTESMRVRAILHVPKTESWSWSSPMRIFRAALADLHFVRVGISTNHLDDSILDTLGMELEFFCNSSELDLNFSMTERYNKLVFSDNNVKLGKAWRIYLKELIGS